MWSLRPVRQAFDDAVPFLRSDRHLARDLTTHINSPHEFSHRLMVQKSRGCPSQATFQDLTKLDRSLVQNDSTQAALCRISLHDYLLTSGAWHRHLISFGSEARENEIGLLLFSGYMQLHNTGQTEALNIHLRNVARTPATHTAQVAFSHAAGAAEDFVEDPVVHMSVDQALAKIFGNKKETATVIRDMRFGMYRAKRTADAYLDACANRGLLKQKPQEQAAVAVLAKTPAGT